MRISGILETSLYADDLGAAEVFYTQVLGLERIAHEPGRHVFFRCGHGVLLVFDPGRTSTERSYVGGALIPLHGSRGAGHVAFAVAEEELSAWRARLEEAGVAIESDVRWPHGGRSIYFRDPAGNSIELASPQLWGR